MSRPKKRDRLAELIVETLQAEFGIEVDNVRLYPAKGFWRTNRLADVMPWTGYADVTIADQKGSYPICLGSWDTMTDLLRLGPFSVDRDATNGFEFYAGHVKQAHPAPAIGS